MTGRRRGKVYNTTIFCSWSTSQPVLSGKGNQFSELGFLNKIHKKPPQRKGNRCPTVSSASDTDTSTSSDQSAAVIKPEEKHVITDKKAPQAAPDHTEAAPRPIQKTSSAALPEKSPRATTTGPAGSIVWDIELEDLVSPSQGTHRHGSSDLPQMSVTLDTHQLKWAGVCVEKAIALSDTHGGVVARDGSLLSSANARVEDITQCSSPSLGPSQSASQHGRSVTQLTIPPLKAISKYFSAGDGQPQRSKDLVTEDPPSLPQASVPAPVSIAELGEDLGAIEVVPQVINQVCHASPHHQHPQNGVPLSQSHSVFQAEPIEDLPVLKDDWDLNIDDVDFTTYEEIGLMDGDAQYWAASNDDFGGQYFSTLPDLEHNKYFSAGEENHPPSNDMSGNTLWQDWDGVQYPDVEVDDAAPEEDPDDGPEWGLEYDDYYRMDGTEAVPCEWEDEYEEMDAQESYDPHTDELDERREHELCYDYSTSANGNWEEPIYTGARSPISCSSQRGDSDKDADIAPHRFAQGRALLMGLSGWDAGLYPVLTREPVVRQSHTEAEFVKGLRNHWLPQKL